MRAIFPLLFACCSCFTAGHTKIVTSALSTTRRIRLWFRSKVKPSEAEPGRKVEQVKLCEEFVAFSVVVAFIVFRNSPIPVQTSKNPLYYQGTYGHTYAALSWSSCSPYGGGYFGCSQRKIHILIHRHFLHSSVVSGWEESGINSHVLVLAGKAVAIKRKQDYSPRLRAEGFSTYILKWHD